jgi:hypothetical protein
MLFPKQLANVLFTFASLGAVGLLPRSGSDHGSGDAGAGRPFTAVAWLQLSLESRRSQRQALLASATEAEIGIYAWRHRQDDRI